jgi:hypothetical protein
MQSTDIGKLEAALKEINDIQSRCEEAVRNVKEIITEFKEMETKSAKEKTSVEDVISSMKEFMAEFKEEKTTKPVRENPYNQRQMEKFRVQMTTSIGHRCIRHLIDEILDHPKSHAALVWYMRDNLMDTYGMDEPTARGKVLDFLSELINEEKVDEKLFIRFCVAMGITDFEMKITTKNTKTTDTKISLNNKVIDWE